MVAQYCGYSWEKYTKCPDAQVDVYSHIRNMNGSSSTVGTCADLPEGLTDDRYKHLPWLVQVHGNMALSVWRLKVHGKAS